MAFILAGLVIIAFGLSKIYFKDLWWFDSMILQRALGRVVERTERWEHEQDRQGLIIACCGLFLLFYNAFLTLI